MKRIIIIISVVLFAILIFRSCYDIGIASVKNDHLIAFLKDDVDKMDNIDSVKKEAKKSLDIIKANRHEHSHFARQTFWLLVLLFFIQILLWGRRESVQNYKDT